MRLNTLFYELWKFPIYNWIKDAFTIDAAYETGGKIFLESSDVRQLTRLNFGSKNKFVEDFLNRV